MFSSFVFTSLMMQERKWGAAVGWVGTQLTVAGGGDYGDETVDTLLGDYWARNHEVTSYHKT